MTELKRYQQEVRAKYPKAVVLALGIGTLWTYGVFDSRRKDAKLIGVYTRYLFDAWKTAAWAVRLGGEVSEWISVNERLPEPSEWVLAWIYLPKNPPASGHAIAQYSGCAYDEPESYEPFRRTEGCWWANGRYYEKGHVTHWIPLLEPPKERP